MKIIIADNPSELILLLRSLEVNRYIFRGQSNAKHTLLPNAYRLTSLDDFNKNFLDQSITNRWYFSEVVNKSIRGWSLGFRPSDRFFEYVLHLMKYNNAMQKFYKLGKLRFINYNDQFLLETFPDDHWIEQGTFEALFDYFLRSVVSRISLEGIVLKEPYYSNENTGYDQSAPQHYSFPTPFLDWTDDPLVAMYFALGKDAVETKRTEELFTIASSLPPAYLAIFAYRQLNKPDSSFPIQILSNTTKYNPRIIAQKGKFISLTRAMEYYLANGTYPSMESYDLGDLDLVRIVFKRTPQNINYLNDYIKERNICESTLFPDKILMEVCC
jgi:hypothetical protein